MNIHSRFGRPRKSPFAMLPNESGSGWTVLASVSTSTAPRAMASMPSVTMNGGSLPYATSEPLKPPIAAPAAIAMTIAGTTPTPCTSSSAARQPVSPSTEPTDRSMPAVRMTSSWPTAMIPKTATCRARFAMLSPVRNSVDARVMPPNRTSRTMRPPASRPKTSPKVRTRSPRSAGAALAAPAGAPAAAGAGSMVSLKKRIRVLSLPLGRVARGSAHRRAGQVQHVLLRRPRRGQLARDRPLAHDQHAVGQPEHLGQVGRHDDHAEAFGREVADDLVDLGLRPHVDALGGLVEHEHLRLRRQPPGEEHLLLVAARQRRDRLLPRPGAQLQPAEVLVDDRALALLVDDPEARDLVDVRDRGVLADRQLEQQAEVLAVLGQQPEPGPHRAAGVAAAHPLAVDDDLTAVNRVGAEDRAQELAATRAQQARDADDLPGAHLEGNAVPTHRRGANRLEPAHGEARLADRAVRRGVQRLDLAAHHRGDQRVLVEVAHRLARDEAAVAQDRDPVADLEHLLEVVGHVHHGVPLVAELMDAGEQRLRLGFRQRRRRLVEDEHPRRRAEHLGDLDELLRGERQRRDLGARVEPVEPDAIEHRLRLPAQLGRAGDAAARRELPHEQVLADRQVRQEAELLVDDADAGLAHPGGRRIADLLAVDQVLTRVALDRAGEDLDQRALAGPVLAGEAHDLAGAELERDAGERLDRPVGLRGVAKRDDRRLHRDRLLARRGRGAHDQPCALAVGGLSSGWTAGVPMFDLSATTAPGSRFSGGSVLTAAMPASTTPW